MFRSWSARCFNCAQRCASLNKINMQQANCSRNRKLLWQFLMFLKRVQKVQKQHYKQWSRQRHVKKPEPFWLLTMTWSVCQNASKFEKCEAVQMTLNVHVGWPKNAKNVKLSKWLKTSVKKRLTTCTIKIRTNKRVHVFLVSEIMLNLNKRMFFKWNSAPALKKK